MDDQFSAEETRSLNLDSVLPSEAKIRQEGEEPEIQKKENGENLGGNSSDSFPLPGSGKSKKKLPIMVLALILISLPVTIFLVKRSQEIRRQAGCNPDPDKCWTYTNKSTKEGCEAWCVTQEEYEKTCYSYKVLDENCQETLCWYCKKIEQPTPGPGECQSSNLSQRTKEACEEWCRCTPGGDIYNEYEDTCFQSSDNCWYCKKRPEPLNDCCACWSECEGLVCPAGLECLSVGGVKRCVNPSCPTDSDCVCDQVFSPTPTNTLFPSPTPTKTPTPTPTNTPKPSNTPTTTPNLTPTSVLSVTPPLTPSPSPTGSAAPSISCEFCRLYDEDWQLLEIGTAVFEVGQQIHLTTRGATSDSQGITKARFRVSIDGQKGSWQESAQKKEEKFYLPYAIAKAGTYEIESMVYNPTLGWH